MDDRALKKEQVGSAKSSSSSDASGESPEPSRLDLKITAAVAKLRRFIERTWKPMLFGFAVVAGAIGAGILYQSWVDSKEMDLQKRLFDLTKSTSTPTLFGPPTTELALPDLAGFQALLGDSAGTKSDRLVLQSGVLYLLEQADAFARKQKADAEAKSAAATSPSKTTPPDAESTPDEAKSPPGPDPAAARASIIAGVREMISSARTRFDGDQEMLGWMKSIEEKLDIETNRSWLPPARKFSLQPPPATSSETPETPSPAPSTTGAGT
jgi:hypothetical protein